MSENNQKVININIENEMKNSFIDYAMSVIVSRALPDVRDGLKPVHRRILYSMYELGLTPDKGYRKSARIVGDVLGKYHPHGDSSVYDAMVRMAQYFSIRYGLVDGHGNFGSVDGDSAAAMRYTEAKMSKISQELMADIDKETVDFMPNFDETLKEPIVLPCKFPNLLVNGSSGIAVGMATNIPPHNLGEVIDGTIELIDNPDITIEELMRHIKGPDFPTSGIILGKSGIKKAYLTGRGKVITRARTNIEETSNNRFRIIVTELPYQVNKAKLIEKIADHARNKNVEGISDIRDESDRNGMRIVIELKRDSNPNVVLNYLYKHTQLQDTFGVIMLALVDGVPKVLNLKEVLSNYVKHQKDVITRRTKYNLSKAEARAHILEGLLIALDNIDEVISIIRNSKTVAIARQGLMDRFSLSEKQSQAILDMRLQRLTGLERERLQEEYDKLMKLIEHLKAILANEYMVYDIIKEELTAVKTKYADERKTEISFAESDIDIEDLIDEHDIVITLTHFGYVKRIPLSTYNIQHRGGRGITALQTREDDFIEDIFVTSTHHNLLFFTSKGKVYSLKAYQIPEAGRQAKGTPIINLLRLDPDEKIQALIPTDEMDDTHYIIMSTKKGYVKKSAVKEFANMRSVGLIAINLRDDDELIQVQFTDGEKEIMIATASGLSIRFHESDVRPMGRTAAGVKGINLKENDYVIGMQLIKDDCDILTVSKNGYGKRTPKEEYRLQNRGGTGIFTMKITEKTGELIALKMVKKTDELIMINSDNVLIRINASEISKVSRNTQGVLLMRMAESKYMISVARIDQEEQEISEEIDKKLENREKEIKQIEQESTDNIDYN